MRQAGWVQVLKIQQAAKAEGYADVLYLDAATDTYLEEVSSCNIFTLKGNTIKTPPLQVLPFSACQWTALLKDTRSSQWNVAFKCTRVCVTVSKLIRGVQFYLPFAWSVLPLQGTILPGVTRKSVIELARLRGYTVEEAHISLQEAMEADEVFTTGTAVVLCSVGSLTHKVCSSAIIPCSFHLLITQNQQ